MKDEKYKKLSVREFTQAAEKYESDDAGVYKMCKKDYPEILEEIRKEEFHDLLDAGCGTAPMISLLVKEYPDKHYTGIDITPKMIEVAKAKQLPGVSFICGDCGNLPFGENSFDIIICSQSFHHYPKPQDFFFSVARTLRPGGRLILRDITLPPVLMWLANHIEIPILNLLGYGDVRCYGKKEISSFCEAAGLTLESFERRHFMRLHAVIRKG